jgi:MFS family permease
MAGLIADSRIVAGAIAASLLGTWMATAAHIRRLTPLAVEEKPLRVTRAFVDLFISRACVFLGFYTLLGYLYFYVRQELGPGAKMTTSVLILVVTASAALGAIGAARIARNLDRRGVVTIGGAGFIGGLCAFLLSHSAGALALSAFVAGAAWGVFVSADWALGCSFLPRHALATAMAVWNLALLLPQIAAPAIATALLSSLHALQSGRAPRIAFLAAACEVAVGIAWIWRLPASVRSVEPAPSGNTT